MRRRRFNHLLSELSLAVGAPIPRFQLWMELHEYGWDPELLTRDAAIAFCQAPVHTFLASRRLRLSARASRILRRRIAQYDASAREPEDHLAHH